MAKTAEQQAIFVVLRQLRTDDLDRTRPPPDANAVLKVARTQFTPLGRYELDTLEHRSTGRFPVGSVIYIDPPSREKSAVAALWCRWDFNAYLPRCGFYLGIWSAQRGFPNPNSGHKHPAFTGFRYETPEDGDNHDYYHAQPCRSMGGDEDVRCALPISPRVPTFPLAAQSSLALLLCLVTSVYGMAGLKKLQSKVSGRNKLLRQSIEDILELKRAETGS